MKPATKFRRAIMQLAKNAGVPVVDVTMLMSGVDSRTRKGWITFHLKLSETAAVTDDFLAELKKVNGADPGFLGRHSLTDIAFKVTMAVRMISVGTTRYGVTADGTLQPIY